MNTAEIWVFLAFIFFLILLGKKCYLIIVNALDDYISSVKKKLYSAKNLKNEARQNFEKAKLKGAETQSKIESTKKNYEDQTKNLTEYYKTSIENFKNSSEKNLKNTIELESNFLKNSLIKNIEKEVVNKLKNKFKEETFDISILTKHKSEIEKLLNQSNNS